MSFSESNETFENYVRITHETASNRVLGLANAIDSLFGDRRATDDINRTTLRISDASYWSELDSFSNDFDINFSLKLPILERQGLEALRALKNAGPSAVKDGADTGDAEPDLTRAQLLQKTWNFHVEPGVRVGPTLNYRLRGRARRTFQTQVMAHHFSEQLIWSNTDLWISETSLLTDAVLSDVWLFRFVTQATWAISNRNLSTSYGPSFIRKLGDTAVASFDIRALSSMEERSFGLRNYSAGATYHKTLMGNWMFFDITPGVSFPRSHDFQGAWFVDMRLELVFGQI